MEEDSLLESSSSSLDSSTPDLESSLNSNVGSGDHDKYPSISSEDGESVEHEKINPKQDNMIQLLLSQLRLAHDGPSNEPQGSRTFGKMRTHRNPTSRPKRVRGKAAQVKPRRQKQKCTSNHMSRSLTIFESGKLLKDINKKFRDVEVESRFVERIKKWNKLTSTTEDAVIHWNIIRCGSSVRTFSVFTR